MKLTLKDRILMSGLIPAKGNFEDLIVAEDLRKKISVTQDEIKEAKIKTDQKTGNINWEKEIDADIKLTEAEEKMVSKQLEELNKKDELTKDHIELYKTFVKK